MIKEVVVGAAIVASDGNWKPLMWLVVRISFFCSGILMLIMSAVLSLAGRGDLESIYWATVIHRVRGQTGEFSPHQIAMFQPETGFIKHLPDIESSSIRVFNTPDPAINWFVIRDDWRDYTIYPVDTLGRMGDAIFSFGDSNRLFHGFSWSPNGEWAVFSANDVFITLYRINANGTNAIRIADETEYDIGVSQNPWSYDSEWFYHNGRETLYRIHQSGSPIEELDMPFPAFGLLPAPDGKHITYFTELSRGISTFIFIDTVTNELQKTSIEIADSVIDWRWANDGNLILRTGFGAIIQLDLSSLSSTTIFESSRYVPVWRDDNEWVAIMPIPPDGATNYTIDLIRLDGQTHYAYEVKNTCQSYYQTRWYGHPQRLIFSQEYNGNCALFYLEGGSEEARLLKTFSEPLGEIFVSATPNPNWVAVSTSSQYLLDLNTSQLIPIPYGCCVAAWQELPVKSGLRPSSILQALILLAVALADITRRSM